MVPASLNKDWRGFKMMSDAQPDLRMEVGTWPFPMASGRSMAQGTTSEKPIAHPGTYPMRHQMKLGEHCQQEVGNRNQEGTSSWVSDAHRKQNTHALLCAFL